MKSLSGPHPGVFSVRKGEVGAPKSVRFTHKEQLTRKAPEIVFLSLRTSAGTSFLKIPAHLQKTLTISLAFLLLNNKRTLHWKYPVFKEKATLRASSPFFLCLVNSIPTVSNLKEVGGGGDGGEGEGRVHLPSPRGAPDTTLPSEARSRVQPYLGLEVLRTVVRVLGVHLWLIQAFAHVAGIFISEAGNWITGYMMPQASFFLLIHCSRQSGWLMRLPRLHHSLVPTP